MDHPGYELESDPYNAFVAPWVGLGGPGREPTAGPPDSDRGPLAGVRVALKDCFYVSGRIPTMGSRLHPPARSGTATVVERIVAAGAEVVGFTNMHEWAVGGTSAITATGPIRNPRDPSLIAGGSSGGSAVAVATGAARSAIGTDAGGSIRIPAACCGVVGLKPTFGLVPVAGSMVQGPTDHIGTLGATVADAVALVEVIAGGSFEERDPSTLRIGIARGPLVDAVEDPVGAGLAAAAQVLAGIGASATDVTISHMTELGRMNGRLFLADTAARLGDDLDRRADELDPSTRAILERARAFSAAELGAARAARDEARVRWMAMFEQIDVLVTPTLPTLPPPIKEVAMDPPSDIYDPDRAYGSFNGPMNLLGLPAVSLPCGEAGPLTVSATFTAAPNNDGWVIALARAFESTTESTFLR